MAFRNSNNNKDGSNKKGGNNNSNSANTNNIDMVIVDARRDGNTGTGIVGGLGGLTNNNLNIQNFGEYQDFLLDPNALIVDDDGDATGFAIPIDLNQMTDHELAERWVLAEQSFHQGGGSGGSTTLGDSQETTTVGGGGAGGGVGNSNTQGTTSGGSGSGSSPNKSLTQLSQEPAKETWGEFNPADHDLEGVDIDEGENNKKKDAMSGDEEDEDEDVDVDVDDDSKEENKGEDEEKEEEGGGGAAPMEEDDDDPMPLPDEENNNGEEPVMMDDDDEEAANDGGGGRVSEIEVARAADDSMLSENQEVRMSIQGDEVMDQQGKRNTIPETPGGASEASFPIPNDDADLGEIPMPGGGRLGVDDNDDTVEVPTIDGADDVAGLSFSRDSVTGGAGAASVGGLDESTDNAGGAVAEGAPAPAQPTDEESEAPKPKKRKKQEGPKRRRTRRKVVIDNDATELDGDHIKNMLQDTSDITLPHIPHPADWPVEEGGGDRDDNASYLSQSQGGPSLTTYEESYFSGGGGTRSNNNNNMPTQETGQTFQSRMAVPSGIAGAVGQEDRLILDHLSFEELLLRPSLGDDGQLHPELLQLWRDNLHYLEGKPCPYPKRSTAEEEEDEEDDDEDEEQAEDDVEVARGGEDEEETKGGEEEEDEAAALDEKKDKDPTQDDPTTQPQDDDDDDDEEMPLPDDDDAPMPPPDDDEHENAGGLPMGSDEAPPLPFDDEEEEQEDGKPTAKTSDEEKSTGSTKAEGQEEENKENKFGLSNWGMVNDATGDTGGDVAGGSDDEERDEEDDPRQEAGTELVSSSTKWHKHTVRVLNLLQHNMGDKGGKQDADGKDKLDSLIFGNLVKNCSRRTAAGVFFEILQLKTWDFVEVEQDEAEGPITVSPGPRFVEDPPKSTD